MFMRIRVNKTIQLVGLCFLTFIVPANKAVAETPNLWIDEGFILTSYDGFSVAPVENNTGEAIEDDITDIIEAKIQEQLVSAHLKVLSSNAPDKKVLVIKAHLTLYLTGSAFERWVGLFGPSATSACVLRVLLEDAGTGEVVGDMVVVRNISGGLLGAPGAEEKVLGDVAEYAVAAISKRMKND
jgi:hypothetical protein